MPREGPHRVRCLGAAFTDVAGTLVLAALLTAYVRRCGRRHEKPMLVDFLGACLGVFTFAELAHLLVGVNTAFTLNVLQLEQHTVS